MRARVRTQLGGAVLTTLALAVMVLGTVFVAVAGPRYSLQTRTNALQQSISTLPPMARAVSVSTDLGTLESQLAANINAAPSAVPESLLNEGTGQISSGLQAAKLKLAGGAWAGLTTTKGLTLTGGVAPSNVGGNLVNIELIYRGTLAAQSTLTAGSYRDTTVGADGALPVATSQATATQFGWHVGSVATMAAIAPVKVKIVAIFRPRRPAAGTFWTQDPVATTPSFFPGDPHGPPPSWTGAVFPVPGSMVAMQQALHGVPTQALWVFPLNLSGLSADQVQDLLGSLNTATAGAMVLQGDLAGVSPGVTAPNGLVNALTVFFATDGAIQQVLSLEAVSLTLIGVMLLLLTARIVAARRYVELTLMRSRGAALWQVTALTLRGGAIAVVPAVIGGALAAILATPGLPETLAWWLGGITALVALAGLPVVATWQHRKPATSSNPAVRGRRVPRRLVAEVTASAAAAGGLVVLHAQGAPPPGSLNLYIAAAPALIAIPAVIIIGRLYPLVIHALLPLTARGRGSTGFLALARAARTSLASLAPAFALVLALTIASFAGMVQQAVSSGQVTASWQSTGADVAINVAGSSSAVISAADQAAIAALPGVEHVTTVWDTEWQLPSSGNTLQGLVVDPASYAAFTAATPSFPAVPAAGLGGSATGVLRVLASPGVAAELGSGTATITNSAGMGPLTVHVAGTLDSTPASTANAVFLILPLRQFPHQVGAPAWNMLLIDGSHVNHAALAATVSRLLPGAGITITYRSAALAQLTGSALQAAAYRMLRISLAVAAGFGFMIVLLGLALGSADRELTLARLDTMGLTRGRLNWLVLLEALPAVIAAAAAAAACAAVLPTLISPALDLSVFTGSGTPVTFVPDLADVGLPAAVLVVLAALAVGAELRMLRGNLAGLLRTGG